MAPLDPTAEGPPGGAAHWLTAADGTRLRAAHWAPESPHGTVFLFPGRTECVEKYGRTAADLARLGYAMVTVDWRGQGLADRPKAYPMRGHVHSFLEYQQDVAALVAYAERLGLPRPWHLLAHSMGGCIALRSLIQGLPVRTAAFSAPMWGISMASALRPVARAMSSLASMLGQGLRLSPGQVELTYLLREPFAGNTLTSDKDQWDYMRAQILARPELALGGPTLAWLNAALREMRALSALPSPNLPVVTFLGENEAIVDPGPIRTRMSAWSGADMILLPQARHEVLMEAPATRARVFARLAELMAA